MKAKFQKFRLTLVKILKFIFYNKLTCISSRLVQKTFRCKDNTGSSQA
jgi:hypothetical protein